ncbi:glycosyltransferase family 2 protein [Pedobacter sp. AW31-3R]|uniref:glycosyltransferase family 2 protein n=1 Tax=Pedobacter sp. AW31-3R TaxID=3445781 RepID=UPI003FA01835
MIIRVTHPLVSCICVTAYRPAYLLKAIIGFDTQKYPNKELVISYPKDDHESKDLVKNIAELSDLEIVVVERDNHLSLGMARNEAISKSNGAYICTWDDDDWYSERRVHHQYNDMLMVRQKREASILTNVMLYNSLTDEAHVSSTYKIAGSLLCKKDIVLQHPYEDADIIEDASLIRYLERSKYLHIIADRPDLYIYNYHGANKLDKYYFIFLQRSAKLLDQATGDWVRYNLNRQVGLTP